MTEKKHDDPPDPKPHPHHAAEPHKGGPELSASRGGSLLSAGTELLRHIIEVRAAIKDNVEELRKAYADFKSKMAGERLSPQDEAIFSSMQTDLESELNKLDPDSPVT